jgi:hypothetical protein
MPAVCHAAWVVQMAHSSTGAADFFNEILREMCSQNPDYFRSIGDALVAVTFGKDGRMAKTMHAFLNAAPDDPDRNAALAAAVLHIEFETWGVVEPTTEEQREAQAEVKRDILSCV